MFRSLVLICATFASQAAFALEPTVIDARFTWIVPDRLLDAFPNGELSIAQSYWIRNAKITKSAQGKWSIELQMPRELVAGKIVKTVYQQAEATPDGQTYFRNAQDSDDYLLCGIQGATTWGDVGCNRIMLDAVGSVPLQERLNHIESRYGGTPMAVGLREASKMLAGNAETEGVEPGGEIAFQSPPDALFVGFAGEWEGTLLRSWGSVPVKVFIDGAWGGIRFKEGNVWKKVAFWNAYEPSLGVDYEATNWSEGEDDQVFTFKKTPDGKLEGTWGTFDLPGAFGKVVATRVP